MEKKVMEKVCLTCAKRQYLCEGEGESHGFCSDKCGDIWKEWAVKSPIQQALKSYAEQTHPSLFPPAP